MQQLVTAGHELMIISQRRHRPCAVALLDLHLAARSWVVDLLQIIGHFVGMGYKSSVHCLETRDQKVAMVADLICSVFINDLPEVLAAPGFSYDIYRILFGPSRVSQLPEGGNNDVISAWCQLPQLISALAL